MSRGCSGSARSAGQETELGNFMAVCGNWLSTDTTMHILWAKAAPVGDVLRKFPDFQAGWDDLGADAVGVLVGGVGASEAVAGAVPMSRRQQHFASQSR